MKSLSALLYVKLQDMTITQILEVNDLPEITVKIYLRGALGIQIKKSSEECVHLIINKNYGFEQIKISDKLDEVVENAIKRAKKDSKKK